MAAYMILLVFLALVPTIALMVFIYYKDSCEKEPVGLLIQLFLLGVVSIIPAIILELIGTAFLDVFVPVGSIMYHFFDAFFVVALAEEGGKFLFLYIRTWHAKEFNFKFDGIVYAVFVSLGFATLENILYVVDGGISTAVMRALLSVPSHAIDAVFMGYYYGKAKFCEASGDRNGKNNNLLLSFAVAMALHGFYDFCLFANGYFLVFFFIFVVLIDIFAIVRVNKSSKENMQIIYNRYAPQGNFYMRPGYGYVPQGYGVNYMPYGAPNNINMMKVNMPNGYAPNGMNMAPGGYVPNGMNNGLQENQTNITGNNHFRPVRFYVYCPKCGNRCNANTFCCTACGNPLHK
ncbi:MAG: PrsW family glutamic-type intramembrane protease [Eubacteriales bacterium]|nr:PrsW family glutamic-type intramembrane protease [Eubacteriales bacterium]